VTCPFFFSWFFFLANSCHASDTNLVPILGFVCFPIPVLNSLYLSVYLFPFFHS
jgi:hypothetical protein